MVIKEFGVDLYHAFDIIKTGGIIIDNPPGSVLAKQGVLIFIVFVDFLRQKHNITF